MKTTKETMMEYFDQLNTGDFERVVPLLFTEDLTFVSPKRELTGLEAMTRLFIDAHPKGTKTVLRPTNMCIDGDNVAVEISEDWIFSEDIPETFVGPVKKGDTITMKIAGFYKVRNGKIAHVTVYEFPSS